MTPTLIFYTILGIIILDFLLERYLDLLNIKSLGGKLPDEVADVYEPDKYAKSQEYAKERSRFGLLSSGFSFTTILIVLFFDGFAIVDDYARGITDNSVAIALLFFGILSILNSIVSLPFSLYSTFVIEEKYGFNKITWITFIIDMVKGAALGAIVGGGLVAAIVWIYENTGEMFWILTWIVVSVFMLFTTMFYASWILPMFNKLTPLEEGTLKSKIEAYCAEVDFKLDNLFVMDGSKRSAKANAFFSGLGSSKKIVLYDTLIENHTENELVAVLAHEVGHYKKKHTQTSIVISLLQSGITFFVLSLLLGNPILSQALGVTTPSFHIGIIVFGMLYSPISTVLGIFMNLLSRKNEYEADDFAKKTYNGEALKSALKRLSADTLSNLTPHPIYVFFHYSHPTLVQRLKSLSN